MQNKVIVKLVVPEIGETYDVCLPVNKKIGNIVKLLNKAVHEFTGGKYPLSEENKLYNAITKEYYEYNTMLIQTNIRNGSKLVLLT